MLGYKFRSDIKRDIYEGIAINKLYASSKDELNDPSEMNYDDSELISFLDKHKTHSRAVKEAYKSLYDFRLKKCGILSLSKSICNELLWAYYADGHKGFCIEYETDVIMECYNYGLRKRNGKLVIQDGKPEKEPMVLELNVKYENSFPKLDIDVLKQFSETNDETELLTCTVGTKSEQWQHEDELRLVFSKNGLCEFDYRAVKGIYFGSRFDDSNNEINKIMKLLSGRGIKYYKMKFNPRSYTLTYDRIPDGFSSAPQYIANNLSYKDVKIHSTPEYTEPYRDMLNKALDIVSKEPCISAIKYATVLIAGTPMIAIATSVNDDFISFPDKIFRFDMDIENRSVKLRRFQD